MKVLTSEIFQAYVSTNYGQVNISYHCREFPFSVSSTLPNARALSKIII